MPTFTPKTWVDGPGGGTPINAAALIDAETRLGSPQNVYYAAYQALLTITSPIPIVALTGSFTAQQTTCLLDANGVLECLEPNGYHSTVMFYYADAATIPTAQLTPRSQFASPAAGVTKLRLGGTSSQIGAVPGSFVLAGLTVGHTYRYEVTVAVLGYANPIGLSGASRQLAVSQTKTQYPDSSWYLASRNTDGTCTIIRLDHDQTYKDYVIANIPLPGAPSLGSVAITRDGSKVVVTNQNNPANSVTVINTGALALPQSSHGQILTYGTTNGTTSLTAVPASTAALLYNGMPITGQGIPAGTTVSSVSGTTVTMSAAASTSLTAQQVSFGVIPTIQGTYTLPTGNSAPSPVAISADGLTAWICQIGTATPQLIPMTISTGSFGTALVLTGSTVGYPTDIAIDSAGTYAYIAGGATVFKCNITAIPATISATRTPPSSAVAAALDIAPGASSGGVVGAKGGGTTLWVGCNTPNRLCQWKTSDLTDIVTEVSLVNRPTGLAVFSDNRSLIVVSDTTTDAQISHRWTSDMTEWTEWTNRMQAQPAGYNHPAYDVAFSPAGDIYVTGDQDKTVNSWFGGQINVRDPSDDFYEEDLRVRIVGAT